jgi:hypothetical protein
MKIKFQLMLAASIAVVAELILAGFSFYIGQKNTQALESVFNRGIQQVTQLQKIDSQLREIRFRAAGFLLEQIPL